MNPDEDSSKDPGTFMLAGVYGDENDAIGVCRCLLSRLDNRAALRVARYLVSFAEDMDEARYSEVD